ncbi:MAG: class II fructose-bisphosphatase [Paracoccaceae bacterium]|nr:class II fructose-bisphosphatase [Paracoccaceae bacterium]
MADLQQNKSEEFNDRLLSLSLARVSEAAALATADHIGRGDEDAADSAAACAMQHVLGTMNIDGHIAIGEGDELDTDMLFVGQQLGTGEGPSVDIALMPLEGRTLAAKDMPNALSVVAIGPRGSMLRVPPIYMDKLAIGPGYPDGLLSLEMSPSERITTVAGFRGCAPEELTVCVLDRPRHEALIAEIRETGARVRLISDGDVSGVMACAEPARTGIDLYMGLGGAPEGVLAAAALKCLGGQMQGRLVVRNSDEAARARHAGISDTAVIWSLDEMIRDDVVFAATGITDSALVKGIRRDDVHISTETLLLRSKTGSIRRQNCRRFRRKS